RMQASAANAFATIALFFGLLFIVITPPFGSGDETAHYERAFEISKGAFTGAQGVTAGMQDLMDDAFGKVRSQTNIEAGDYRRWAGIDLNADEITPWPEPLRRVMRLHSPLCYLHLAPVQSISVALGLSPLANFYLGRLAALLIGVALMRAAIALAPAPFRPALVFIGLMPTTVVYLAAYNIDSLLFGLGFYYFALVASLAATPDRRIARSELLQLAVAAFVLGQFKTGYLFLPMLALLLPAAKFVSPRARLTALAMIIMPGAIASLSWAMIVKTLMLGDIVYSTMDGNHVEPAAQLRGMLAEPLAYAGTMFNTLVNSDAPFLAWLSFLALGGWTNIQLTPLFYSVLSIGFLLVWMSGERPPAALRSSFAVALQLGIIAATVGAILTLVYLQWNGVGAPVIDGFQGRYFIAVAPLLLAAAPVRLSLVSAGGRREILAFGAPLIGLIAMSIAVFQRYYA
ncbi:MAG: DUF2142 domain-containing protein, partial [Parvularculaceae bacterium]|nr:DUF2142 domain-containing protein [Parvularculaceae bacterium]